MVKYLAHESRSTFISYSHIFSWKDSPSSGFSFPCEEDGRLRDMPEQARKNYSACFSGELDVVYNGIRKDVTPVYNPAIIECVRCGAAVELESTWSNPCWDCDSEYNANGQLLAPRSQWGEETGEHF